MDLHGEEHNHLCLRIVELEEELAAETKLRERLAEILDEVDVALRGPVVPGLSRDWAFMPVEVSGLKQERDDLAQEIIDFDAKVHDLSGRLQTAIFELADSLGTPLPDLHPDDLGLEEKK